MKRQTLLGGRSFRLGYGLLLSLTACSLPALAGSFTFSTGSPDGKMASASRPDTGPGTEIESADDFVLGQHTQINQATFTGLLPADAPLSSVQQVAVEIYRVFPLDSANPPSGNVPTRVNSPSDVAFDSRDSAAATLTVTPTVVNSLFSAANSVQPGGIHVVTGGNGAVRGEEVQFTVNFSAPIDLAPGHYFFVPQVQLSSGDFYWLSAPKPISGGTPFTPDLQSWIRDANLDPDWLRIGTDIVGGSPAPTFNAAFSLEGTTPTVPDAASTLGLFGMASLGLAWLRSRRG